MSNRLNQGEEEMQGDRHATGFGDRGRHGDRETEGTAAHRDSKADGGRESRRETEKEAGRQFARERQGETETARDHTQQE